MNHLKVQISALCGFERGDWICPDLTQAIFHWGMDGRVLPPHVVTTEPNPDPTGVGYLSAQDPKLREPPPVIIEHRHDGLLHLHMARGFKTSQQARNRAVDQFLDGPCDYLVMVDNDTQPMKDGQPISVIDLCATGLPIIAAPIPTVQMRHGRQQWQINAYDKHPGGTYRNLTWHELDERVEDTRLDHVKVVRCDAVGFGCVAIRRDVLEEIKKYGYSYWDHETPFELARINLFEKFKDNWPAILRTRQLNGDTVTGEDLLLCPRAKDIGFDSYTAVSHPMGHWHTIDYATLPDLNYAMHSPAELGLKVWPDPSPWQMEHKVLAYIRELLMNSPHVSHIIELGSGLSTLVIAAALKARGHGWCASFEEDEGQLAQAEGFLSRNGLDSVVQLVRAPIAEYGDDRLKFYSAQSVLPALSVDRPAHLLIIDGPSGKHNARVNADRFLFDKLAPNALIILDDVDRPHEAQAMQSWIDQGLVRFKERVGRAAVMEKI